MKVIGLVGGIDPQRMNDRGGYDPADMVPAYTAVFDDLWKTYGAPAVGFEGRAAFAGVDMVQADACG